MCPVRAQVTDATGQSATNKVAVRWPCLADAYTRTHKPVELVLVDLAVAVPVGLVDHLLELLVGQVLALPGEDTR